MTDNWWHQVPTMAMLNAKIIGAISSEACIQSAAAANGVGGNYPLINVSHLTGLMYSILVVPKELYTLADAGGREPNDPLAEELSPAVQELQHQIDNLHLEQYLDVSVAPQRYLDNPPREVLRLLRNAVSHVNYEIQGSPPSWSLRFWNSAGSGATNWKATCTVAQLETLLLSLANALHRYYLGHHHS